MFVFVSGNVALDLAGTLKWRRTEPEETLATPDDLDAWLVAAGLLDTPPGADAFDLATARQLREAAYALLTAGGPPPRDALAIANQCASSPPVTLTLTPGGLHRTGPAGAALSDVARALLTLLSEDTAVLKECAKPACTRLYLDRSRGARRTWCGMRECGSQAKMAAYRARRRGSPPAGE
ncbi:CGNR zinc finger domain-containing protein [Actinoplanes sp. NPDC049265]|uniref:CGNR zinc finger domain-containing protein n=1 Tax=Actinoplanes sp. NPDC049265 TaxID=3363902 RepID=UPI0037173CBD